MSSVVVVGSINVDVVMHVPGFPAPGVTLLADRVERSPGGKGANQAVAAARAGAATRLLGSGRRRRRQRAPGRRTGRGRGGRVGGGDLLRADHRDRVRDGRPVR